MLFLVVLLMKMNPDNLLYQQSQDYVEMDVLIAVSVVHVNGLMKLF